MERRPRWTVLVNGRPLPLSDPASVTSADGAKLLARTTSLRDNAEIRALEWTSDQPADWDVERDSIAVYQRGCRMDAEPPLDRSSMFLDGFAAAQRGEPREQTLPGASLADIAEWQAGWDAPFAM